MSSLDSVLIPDCLSVLGSLIDLTQFVAVRFVQLLRFTSIISCGRFECLLFISLYLLLHFMYMCLDYVLFIWASVTVIIIKANIERSLYWVRLKQEFKDCNNKYSVTYNYNDAMSVFNVYFAIESIVLICYTFRTFIQ